MGVRARGSRAWPSAPACCFFGGAVSVALLSHTKKVSVLHGAYEKKRMEKRRWPEEKHTTSMPTRASNSAARRFRQLNAKFHHQSGFENQNCAVWQLTQPTYSVGCARNEKSRPHLARSLFSGMCWGVPTSPAAGFLARPIPTQPPSTSGGVAPRSAPHAPLAWLARVVAAAAKPPPSRPALHDGTSAGARRMLTFFFWARAEQAHLPPCRGGGYLADPPPLRAPRLRGGASC